MCRYYGCEANSMVSVYSTLCRWTATSNFINAVKRQRNLGLHYTNCIPIDTFFYLVPRSYVWAWDPSWLCVSCHFWSIYIWHKFYVEVFPVCVQLTWTYWHTCDRVAMLQPYLLTRISTRLPSPFCRLLLKMTKFHNIIFYLKKNIDDVYIFYWKQ